MPSLMERFRRSWNAFKERDPTDYSEISSYGSTYGRRPDRRSSFINSQRAIVANVYNQIAVDVAAIDIRHIKVDQNETFTEYVQDSLDYALHREANLDQTGRQMIQDLVLSMFDEGVVAAVPVETLGENPLTSDSFSVSKIRIGRIVQWYPKHIKVECYNEDTGKMEQIIQPKRICGIFENPFYATMNETNSTAQRYMRVLSQLAQTNDQNSSQKIDMLIQLPYSLKGESKIRAAEARRQNLEDQLTNSIYGIGYIDATEKVIQLNRSLDNNLWEQAKELLKELYSELGFSPAILDGTADEQTMLNYQNRTIEPIITMIIEEMQRKWLSQTARSLGHSIRYFKQPFKLVPVNQIAEYADKFTRNEIMTSNEFRGIIGMLPVDDPKANELRNANLNHPDEEQEYKENKTEESEELPKDLLNKIES